MEVNEEGGKGGEIADFCGRILNEGAAPAAGQDFPPNPQFAIGHRQIVEVHLPEPGSDGRREVGENGIDTAFGLTFTHLLGIRPSAQHQPQRPEHNGLARPRFPSHGGQTFRPRDIQRLNQSVVPNLQDLQHGADQPRAWSYLEMFPGSICLRTGNNRCFSGVGAGPKSWRISSLLARKNSCKL